MRVKLLEMLTLLLLLVQGAFSWPLWGTAHDYPRIPLVTGPFTFGNGIDTACLGLVGLACLLILPGLLGRCSPGSRWLLLKRLGWGLLACGLAGLILLDQHRLQVWAWQVLLYAICFAGLPERSCEKWLRGLTISLYFYSALSKCDAAFLQTYGSTLLDGLLKSLQWTAVLSPSLRWWFTAAFPAGELLIALLLLFRVTRYFGWILSLFMHVSLLLTLGPWGLQHQPPVLVWNFFFLLQNTLLFTGRSALIAAEPADESAVASVERSPASPAIRTRVSQLLLIFALVFPATEWIDVCDLWPGWGLYSARGARVRLYFPADQAERLPEELRPFLNRPPFGSDWQLLDLQRWSFAELGVPAYPEDRFQLAVAATVLQRIESDIPSQLVHESTAHRWTALRHKTQLHSRDTLQHFSQQYWLNLQPRGEASLLSPE